MGWFVLPNGGSGQCWAHQEVCLYIPGELNLKVWRKLKPPKGWTRRCTYVRKHRSCVKFAAPLWVPTPPMSYFDDLRVKLLLMTHI